MKFILKLVSAIMVLLLICPLCACGRQPYNGEPLELWLVTEESQTAGMNQQAEMMIQRFRELYPNVTIRLDILPRSEEARTAYLKKIRSEIMSGGGPDLYLMPTAPQVYASDERSSTAYMEPLFASVPQQMYNGIFTDISEYYDADTTLGKDGLVTGVMDAGIMDGARYVLPLRYDYDILLVDRDALAQMGIDPSVFTGGIDELYRLAEQLQDDYAAYALTLRPDFTSTSGYIDVKTENVLLDAREVTDLINGYFRTAELSNPEEHLSTDRYVGGMGIVVMFGYPDMECSIDHYISTASEKRRIFSNNGYPFMSIQLSDAVDAAAAIKVQEKNIEMYPVRAVDGRLVAEVTYYGAVGSGCRYPEIAYDFLRLFYSQELQWEQYYPRDGSEDLEGMVEAGFPVRTLGFAEPYYESIRIRLEREQKAAIKAKMYAGGNIRRREKLIEETFTITDGDVPVFSAAVDEARFPQVTAKGEFFESYISKIQTLEDATGMIEDLRWLIAEG